MDPVLATAPVGDVVSLADMKSHLRLDGVTADDALLTTYIAAAVQQLDGFTGILGRCLLSQEWDQSYKDWNLGVLKLPFSDVTSASITFFDATDTEVAVSPVEFDIAKSALGGQIILSQDFDLPTVSSSEFAPITVRGTYGFGASDDVPGPIKVAIMRMVENMYLGDAANVSSQEIARYLAPYRLTGC